MSQTKILVLLAVLAYGRAQTQAPSTNCAEILDRSFECVEKLRTSNEATTLEKKKDAIMQKCAPNLPQFCAATKKASDQCQDQVAKDQNLLTLRAEVKSNVSKCFERFGKSPRAGGPPPPVPPSAGAGFGPGGPVRDPCTPNESQMRCIKTEMRNDRQAHETAVALEQKQVDCYTEGSDDDRCRIDDKPQLRDCVERSKQALVQQAMSKMQECMQTSMGTPPPNSF